MTALFIASLSQGGATQTPQDLNGRGGRPGSVISNGVGLNGVALNGTSFNGVALNGASLNGLAFNSLPARGVVGPAPQGLNFFQLGRHALAKKNLPPGHTSFSPRCPRLPLDPPFAAHWPIPTSPITPTGGLNCPT
ncbi:hypothetical protein [Deinococcus aestuarii]|uniref:hypothetical protein n=1 Tax=Deinococcus aestuarii TaxID=2774531 RepID=UPI001C0C57C1|nr:hypothetical protein [Deinococcus aestuarii]